MLLCYFSHYYGKICSGFVPFFWLMDSFKLLGPSDVWLSRNGVAGFELRLIVMSFVYSFSGLLRRITSRIIPPT
jgi:hypothetical protein